MRGRLRQSLAHLLERVDHRVTAERCPAREQHVEDGPQAVDVGRRRHGPALARGLLGSHVRRRAQDRARAGQLAVAFDPLGQTEVGDMRPPFRIDQDVRRLQIAVKDASLMSVVDRTRGDRHELGGLPGIGHVVLRSLVEALTRDQLHAEVMLILELTDLEDRHNVGMIEPSDRLGLVLKPADFIGTGEPGGLDHLQGHRAIQAELAGLVDDPHAAFAQDSLQLVVAEVADERPRLEGRAAFGLF